MKLDASWLLYPLDPAEFLERYVDREVCHLHGRGADYFNALFSRRLLGEMLWQQEAQAAELVQAHVDGSTHFLPQSRAGEPWEWVREELACEHTVVVNAVSRYCTPVAELCGALAQWLTAPVHANAYLAPPGVTGYAAHFDTDDTVFLQIEGSKRWHLYGAPIPLPLFSQLETVDPTTLGTPRVVELAPGDLLYLPRGTVHTPVAGRAGSLHLTLGLHHRLWRDLLTEAIAVLAECDAELGAPAASNDADAVRDMLHRVVANLAASDAIATARDRLAERTRGKPLPKQLI